jgi:hypothetical protein
MIEINIFYMNKKFIHQIFSIIVWMTNEGENQSLFEAGSWQAKEV